MRFGQYKGLLVHVRHFVGINNINTAVEEVSVSSLNALWHKLLPEFVHDFTGFEPLAAGWRKRRDWMRLHLKMWP